MSSLLEISRQHVLVFLLVTTRISGLVLAAPLLGARFSPFYVRILLVLSLAMLVAPLYVGLDMPHATAPAELLAPLFREAVLGAVMGLSLLILISAAQSAGRIVGQMSGMSLAESADIQEGTSAPLFGRLFDLIAAAAFILVGGHRQVVAALLDSFRWIPPGAVRSTDGHIAMLLDVVGQSFALSFRIAAPVLAALLLASLAVGFVNRTLPQLNVFSMGFSLNALVVLAVVSVTLGGAAWVFQEHADQAIQAFQNTLGQAATNR